MTPEAFLDEFMADEGWSGMEIALELIARTPARQAEASFNVWHIHVDAELGLLRFDHDFEPDEGEMPINQFVDGMRARFEAHPDPRRDTP